MSPLPTPLSSSKKLYNSVIIDEENIIDYQTPMLLLLLKYKRDS